MARIEVRVLAAWVALATAAWGFLTLASEVREGELSAFDVAILTALRQPGDPHVAIGPHWLTESMRDITALGGVTLLILITVVSAVVLLLHRWRREAVVLVATVAFAQAATEIFKAIYGRARPAFALYDLPASHSFPSGHSTVAATTYFLLAFIVARFETSPATKITMFVLAGVLTIAIGISRVFLGVHWPSDVLGGWALGGGLALLSGQLFLAGERKR